jgi:hypothetical protein
MSHGRFSDGWDMAAPRADYEAGTTQTELARRLGVIAETVRLAFHRAGYCKRTMTEVNGANTDRAAAKAQRVADGVRGRVVSTYRKERKDERCGRVDRHRLRPGSAGAT